MTGSYIDNFLNHQLRRLRIAVMGDVMLDRYVFGTVERISPEAPVPVNKVTRTRAVPGGAANVAANLAGLECRVYLAGLIGDDENGRVFRTLVQKAHIDDRGLWQRPHHAMTTKMRILGDRQQMIRLDFERTVTITAAEEAFFSAVVTTTHCRRIGRLNTLGLRQRRIVAAADTIVNQDG